ncbi:hypothetical protein ELUMI_v1c05210 [Williamsoniiplasma luminosum]|uniref:Uncharacterized protein n=1 Tax=Williamsoniiplasma luminosum TaxID=214888 RepID=A0A2K8NTR7_9MOLU|nr:ABC transporter permease [Williamsoniiplasma luminosum]ATZ17245.1 hypothetical protein ELUMI_v1c05210 [Williamsoniiplasma luminosum]
MSKKLNSNLLELKTKHKVELKELQIKSKIKRLKQKINDENNKNKKLKTIVLESKKRKQNFLWWGLFGIAILLAMVSLGLQIYGAITQPHWIMFLCFLIDFFMGILLGILLIETMKFTDENNQEINELIKLLKEQDSEVE